MNLNIISKEQIKILEEIYPKCKKGELTVVKFMKRLILKGVHFIKLLKSRKRRYESLVRFGILGIEYKN